MLVQELLPLFDAVQDIVDATPQQADFRRHLRVPDEVRCTAVDPVAAESPQVGPGTLLIGLIGPNHGAHATPDLLPGLLVGMRPGGQALLLLGYDIDRVPQHQLLGPLVESSCQVVRALPLDLVSRHGVHCALIVECVDKLVAPTAYLTDIRPELDAPDAPNGATDEMRTMLRLANEYVLGDFIARPLRRRLAQMEQKLLEMDQLLAQRQSELDESARALARARKRAARLETSISFQVGRMMVDGVRHPARALVSAPREFVRVLRTGRMRQRQQTGKVTMSPVQVMPAGPPADRVVPVALPRTDRTAVDQAILTVKAPPQLLVPRKLATGGLAGYESDSLACFLAAIDCAGPGAVLDVGANTGIYAALASALASRDVVAFEPTPELVDLARRAAADNGLGYTVEALALGAENGKATFHLSPTDTSSSLAAGFRESTAQIEVEVETVDSYVARTGVVPAVMKVDTETTEPDVLRGAAATITKHRPWILCEVLAGRVEERLTEVLTPFGYHWFHIAGEPPYQEADTIVGDPTYKAPMWLFTPDPPTDRFWAGVRQHRAAIAECTVERGRDLADRQARASALKPMLRS